MGIQYFGGYQISCDTGNDLPSYIARSRPESVSSYARLVPAYVHMYMAAPSKWQAVFSPNPMWYTTLAMCYRPKWPCYFC